VAYNFFFFSKKENSFLFFPGSCSFEILEEAVRIRLRFALDQFDLGKGRGTLPQTEQDKPNEEPNLSNDVGATKKKNTKVLFYLSFKIVRKF
jgi:hypothetical protein